MIASREEREKKRRRGGSCCCHRSRFLSFARAKHVRSEAAGIGIERRNKRQQARREKHLRLPAGFFSLFRAAAVARPPLQSSRCQLSPSTACPAIAALSFSPYLLAETTEGPDLLGARRAGGRRKRPRTDALKKRREKDRRPTTIEIQSTLLSLPPPRPRAPPTNALPPFSLGRPLQKHVVGVDRGGEAIREEGQGCAEAGGGREKEREARGKEKASSLFALPPCSLSCKVNRLCFHHSPPSPRATLFHPLM